MKISLKIILSVLFLAVFMISGLWYVSKSKVPAQEQVIPMTDNQDQQTSKDQSQELSTEMVARNLDVSTWKTYRNEYIGIEFKYPPSWGNIYENREQSCLDFSDARRKQLLDEKDACLHISLSVGESVFLATETPLATKYGLPRGGDWSYKKDITNSQDFCNNNPYTEYKLNDCHVFETVNNIRVTSGFQNVPFTDNETMMAYYISTPNPVYSNLVLSSNYLLAPVYLVNKIKYVSDESEMKILIESMRFIQ